MCGHVRKSSIDEMVKQAAAGALGQFGGLAGDTQDVSRVISAAAFWWCKLYIRFVHHEFIIRDLLGESGHLQGLISPEVLVRMKSPEGDCAIFSECVAAFLQAYGIPYEFVTVAANPAEPNIFSHVYLYAVLADGSRLPLDASHGKYPGWQVPTAHTTRRQVWDSNGSRVPDQGSRFDGLHNYGLRGLGDTGDFGGEYSGDTGQEPATGPGSSPATPGQFIDYTTGTVYAGGPVYQAPSQSSAQWATFASNLAKMGFTLAQINAIQPGTVVGANGSILRQNPGYAVGSPTSSLNLGTGLSTNMLMVGGALLLGVMLLSGKGGR